MGGKWVGRGLGGKRVRRGLGWRVRWKGREEKGVYVKCVGVKGMCVSE